MVQQIQALSTLLSACLAIKQLIDNMAGLFAAMGRFIYAGI